MTNTPRKSTPSTATPDAADLRADLARAEAALKRAEARHADAAAAYPALAEAHRLACEVPRPIGISTASLAARAAREAREAGDRAIARAAGQVKRATAAAFRARRAYEATFAEAAPLAGTGSAAQAAANAAWNEAAAHEAALHAAAAAVDAAARDHGFNGPEHPAALAAYSAALAAHRLAIEAAQDAATLRPTADGEAVDAVACLATLPASLVEAARAYLAAVAADCGVADAARHFGAEKDAVAFEHTGDAAAEARALISAAAYNAACRAIDDRRAAARNARPGRVASVALAVFAFAVPVTLAAYALTPEPHRALAGALCGCLVGPALGIFLAARTARTAPPRAVVVEDARTAAHRARCLRAAYAARNA
jgi:hypothetical protein